MFTSIQRKEIRLFNKRYGVSFMCRWFIYVINDHEALKSAARRPLYLCYLHQFHNWVCSNYCGAMTILWKICSWFDRHIIRGKSRKSLHKHHSLRVSILVEW